MGSLKTPHEPKLKYVTMDTLSIKKCPYSIQLKIPWYSMGKALRNERETLINPSRHYNHEALSRGLN